MQEAGSNPGGRLEGDGTRILAGERRAQGEGVESAHGGGGGRVAWMWLARRTQCLPRNTHTATRLRARPVMHVVTCTQTNTKNNCGTC